MTTGQALDTREQLASYAHEAWSGWMKYLFSKGEYGWADGPIEANRKAERVWMMPAWAIERWQRQMNTPYADLPENEKDSDREEADKMLAILRTTTTALSPQSVAVIRDALRDYEYARRAFYDGEPKAIADADAARTALAQLNAIVSAE